jgi:hypothetical protein
MEGLFVPTRIKRAIEKLTGFLESNNVENKKPTLELLNELSERPSCEPKHNPMVIVHASYESYRHGSFEEENITSLASYLCIMSLNNVEFSYCDRLGKHSEVEIPARDWSMWWADAERQDEEEDDNWSILKSEHFSLRDDVRQILWDTCLEFLKTRPPISIESDDAPEPSEFKEYAKEALENAPYSVVIKFFDLFPTKKLEFSDARAAALFLVLKPDYKYTVSYTDKTGQYHRNVEKTVNPGRDKYTVEQTFEDVVSDWTPPVSVEMLPESCPFDKLLEMAKKTIL